MKNTPETSPHPAESPTPEDEALLNEVAAIIVNFESIPIVGEFDADQRESSITIAALEEKIPDLFEKMSVRFEILSAYQKELFQQYLLLLQQDAEKEDPTDSNAFSEEYIKPLRLLLAHHFELSLGLIQYEKIGHTLKQHVRFLALTGLITETETYIATEEIPELTTVK